MDCPLIYPNVKLIAKQFKGRDPHKDRENALQEILTRGLNRKEIVGVIAMTIENPPKLIYDYYNEGDLHHFIKKCVAYVHGKGKGQTKEASSNGDRDLSGT